MLPEPGSMIHLVQMFRSNTTCEYHTRRGIMHVVVITLHVKMGRSPGHPSWSVGLGKHEENVFPIIPQGYMSMKFHSGWPEN